VNHFKTRVSARTIGLAVVGLVAAAALAACGAGQQAQTAVQQPAVNGTNATIGNLALRDVRIRATQTSDALQPGKTVDLLLVVTNQSPDTSDRLLSVSSDVGTVTLTGNTEIPADGKLIVGKPDGVDASLLAQIDKVNMANATVTLAKPITNGMTYDFAFTFERAGRTTVAVPVTAGTDAPRMEQAQAPAEGQSGTGH
jgi:copper(I)-binding protein